MSPHALSLSRSHRLVQACPAAAPINQNLVPRSLRGHVVACSAPAWLTLHTLSHPPATLQATVPTSSARHLPLCTHECKPDLSMPQDHVDRPLASSSLTRSLRAQAVPARPQAPDTQEPDRGLIGQPEVHPVQQVEDSIPAVRPVPMPRREEPAWREEDTEAELSPDSEPEEAGQPTCRPRHLPAD